MRKRIFLSLAAVVLGASLAHADPVGRYSVSGTNPDSGSTYKGTVVVTRTGETYRVVWKIGGTTYYGTGLGAHYEGDHYVVGPATPDDTVLSVGYVSSGTYGQAFYVLNDDGTWRGVWTYDGSNEVATEDWRPR